MSKTSAEHLSRQACVYIRQSSPGQVRNNLESQRLQYTLVDRARALGWQDVQVIDEDLGISGSGTAHRVGFERLLSGLCEGKVGAVLSIEASRLARNGRDWHTLLEFCSVVGALLIDAEDIYDPRQINDRLLLVMKELPSSRRLNAESCSCACRSATYAPSTTASRRTLMNGASPFCSRATAPPKLRGLSLLTSIGLSPTRRRVLCLDTPTCQRSRYRSQTVIAGSVMLFVRKMSNRLS